MTASAAPSDDLFQSAAGMAAATNYADWTFALFEPFVRGAVLEVGCGVGTFTKRLIAVPALARLLAIDVSAPAVTYCRQVLRDHALELRHADVGEIEGRFDLVVCMNVLEHIKDDQGALRHMLSLVNPGGTLFLLVPAHQFLYSSFDAESGHYRRYSKSGMRALIGQAAGERRHTLRQFYFNSIGALGYWAVYKLLRKSPHADAGGEIGWFDRAVVPVQRRFEGTAMPFGLSLVSVVTRGQDS